MYIYMYMSVYPLLEINRKYYPFLYKKRIGGIYDLANTSTRVIQ